MDLTNETFGPLRVIADEFVRAGIRHAVVAPGSRNAPIAWALADAEGLTSWSVLDERQAGFFALGIAKSTGSPVIVTCTSGTAAANLHPAVLEADHAGVPLVVLTADRPPELRDVGAGQAIDQIKLFGSAVRWFVEAGNHPLSDATLRHFRALASRAVAECGGVDPGPVHVNLPLREPLRPVATELRELGDSPGARGRSGGSRWSDTIGPVLAPGDLPAALSGARRPLIVAGAQHTPNLAAAIAGQAGRLGIPVLADSLSQLRRRSLAEQATIVASYDLIMRSSAVIDSLKPDLVIRVGETPTSKPLRAWLAASDARQIVLDPRGRWQEPSRSASDVWQVDPLATFENLASEAEGSVDPAWAAAWRTIEQAAQAAIEQALAEQPFPFEPAIHRAVLGRLDAASVFISSSMPIRDVEAYGPVTADNVRYLANRGTNGIDGVVSTALGVGAPHDCDQVVLLTGDLAFLYDASALAIAARYGRDLTIVCVDNGGGGIFSFLPIADHPEHFESLIATPPAVDVEAVAKGYLAGYSAPHDLESLERAIALPGFVHVRTERSRNKPAHEVVAATVLEAIDAALAETGRLS